MLAASSRKHIAQCGPAWERPGARPATSSKADMKTILPPIAALALSGCAFVYDQVQYIAQSKCANNGNAQEQRACEKRNAPAYDDYEARRKRLQEGGKPG
jgi:hypothetical protein